MSGVDDQVEEHLPEVALITRDRREIAEVRLHLGDMPVLAPGDRQRVGHQLVEVQRAALRIRVPEPLHGADDGGHPLDAVECAPDGIGHLRLQKGHVHRLLPVGKEPAGGFGDQAPALPQHRPVVTEQLHEGAQRMTQELDVVAHVLHGGVDLMRDAGREPAHRFEALGLDQICLQPAPVRDVVNRPRRAGEAPLGITQASPAGFDGAGPSVGSHQAELELAILP